MTLGRDQWRRNLVEISEKKRLHDLDLDGMACIEFVWLRTACCEHGHESSAVIKQMSRISL